VRLVGIEMAAGEFRVAWGERWLGAVRLTAVDRVPHDGDAGSLRTALAALAVARPAVVLTTMPLARTTHRLLALPFRDRTRLADTAPLELLGQLPLGTDDAVVATRALGRTAAGSEVLAVAVARAALDAHAATFDAAGLPATRVDLAPLPALVLLPDADVALVLADGPASALVVRRAGRVAGLRALGAEPADAGAFATEARWTLRALGGAARVVVAGPDAARAQPALAAALDGPVDALTPAAALAGDADPADVTACAVAAGLVLGEGRRDATGVTLAGQVAGAPGRWRRSVALATLALVLGVLDVVLVRTALVRRAAALERAATELAAAAMPGTPVQTARAQLEGAVAARRRLRPAGDMPVLEVLRELSERVPETLRLDLDELVIEPDAIRLHGRGQSFDAVEALRAALAASPLVSEVQADDTRTTVDGAGVEFTLRAVRRSAMGAPS
jgi:type II secretion system protein L